jgi:uncharacterized protein with HEPN domain
MPPDEVKPDRTDAYLRDIVDAAKEIAFFLEGVDKDSFLADRKTQRAVLYDLAIIGEAVKTLPETWRSQHPALPWRLIGRMRDHLIHHYFAVDMEIIWTTATQEAPALLAYLTPLLAEKNNEA